MEFSQGDLGRDVRPTSNQEFFFSGLFKELQFGTVFWKIFVLIASGTKTLWRISLKFNFFFGNIAFPLLSVYTAVYLVGHLLPKYL